MAHKLTVRQGGGTATVLDYTAQIPVWQVSEDQSIPMISGGGRFDNGSASQGEFVVIDDAGEIPKADGTKRLSAHNQVTWSEDGPGYDAWLSRGRIVTKNIDGGDHEWGDSRTFKVTYNDSNHDLIGLTLTADWVRSAETDVERVIALGTAFLNGSPRATTVITCGTAHLVPNTNTVTMPAKTYPAGTELTEILDDCARTAGKLYGVVLHHVSSASHECLQYIDEFDHSTYLSTLTITDDEPDTVTEFAPIWDQGDAAIEEGIDLVTGIVSRYGTGTASFVYVEDSADVASYDYWVLPYQDSASVTSAQATTRANAVRDSLSHEHVTHQVTIKLPADKVDLLAAGMSINIRSARSMGGQYLHTTQTRRIAQLKWEPTAPEVGAVVGQYYAHMQLDRPLSVLAEKPQPVGPKPPSPGAAASCSLADEQMTAIPTPNGDFETGNYEHWHPGAGVSADAGDPSGVGGSYYSTDIGVGAGGFAYYGWLGSYTFQAGVTYVARAWCAGGGVVIRFGVDGDLAEQAIVHETDNCIEWTPSATTDQGYFHIERPTAGTVAVDNLRAFAGSAGDVPVTIGGPGEGAIGTGTPVTVPIGTVIEHGDLSGKGGTMHDASQIEFTPTGTIAATNSQTAIAEVATDAAAALAAKKLDDLAAPDDNTDLNATTSAHGLLPKLGGGSTNFLRADGTWAAPSGGGGGSLTVEEVDGSPTDSAVTKIVFPNGTLGITSHVATYTPSGGGGGGSTPTIVDTATAYISTATGSITIPATTSIGDWLFLFDASNYAATVPSGWLKLAQETGSFFTGFVAFRVAQSGDAGSTLNVSLAGAEQGELCIVVVDGGSSVSGVGHFRNTSGTTFTPLPAINAKVNDLALYFGGCRAATPTITSSIGSAVVSRAADASSGMTLYSQTHSAGGPVAPTFTVNKSTSGVYGAVVTISG